MNKQCRACGSQVPFEAKFCQTCGSADFIVPTQQPTNDTINNQPNYNQNPYQQQPINQGWQPPVPQNQPKKKNTGLIIGIVAGVLIVLAGIGFAAQNALQNADYDDNDDYYGVDGDYDFDDDYDFDFGSSDSSFDNSDDNSSFNDIEYTKGTFDGSVYRNEWANMELTVPEGYIEGNQVNYDSFSDNTTECGLYLISPQHEMYAISFVDVSSQSYVNENTFLAQLSISLMNANIENVEYKIPDSFEDITIAGKNFIAAHYTVSSYGAEFVQSYYVKKIDDRLCNIIIINSTKEENNALVGNITSTN